IALFAVLCGVGAVVVYWLIAYEVATATRGSFWFTFGILGTLGLNQLFFGYIEAYPPAALFDLIYVWLGTRSTREPATVGLSGVALGIAIASHLANSYLLPSYVVLIWMRRRPL